MLCYIILCYSDFVKMVIYCYKFLKCLVNNRVQYLSSRISLQSVERESVQLHLPKLAGVVF